MATTDEKWKSCTREMLRSSDDFTIPKLFLSDSDTTASFERSFRVVTLQIITPKFLAGLAQGNPLPSRDLSSFDLIAGEDRDFDPGSGIGILRIQPPARFP
jgi:hypothetical protein